MKKIFLSVFALIIALFLFQPGFVHAEEVNLFNVSNISQYTSIVSGMEFTTGFIYTDTSLPDGYYEITISSGLISTTPDDYHSVFISNDNEDFFINQALAKNYDSGTEVFSYVFYVADGTFQIDFLDSSGDTVFAQDPQYVTSMNFGIYSFDLSVPVFSYSSLTYDTSYADLITVAEVQADLSVMDPVDGDLTSAITIYQDDYTLSAQTIGETYSIIFSVENSLGYQAFITVDITIVDDVAPYVEYQGDTYYDSPLGEMAVELIVSLPYNFTSTDFENAIKYIRIIDQSEFSENSSSYTSSLKEFSDYQYLDVSEHISAIFEGYPDYATFINEDVSLFSTSSYYYINALNVYYTDIYGNELEFLLLFDFYDASIPTFDSTSPDKIVKPSTASLTLADITALIDVSDTYDAPEDLTLTVLSDSYTGHEDTMGRYVIVYQVEDASGNTATHSVVVWVVNVTAPIVTVLNNNLVTVSINTPMDEADIIAMLDSYGIVVTELSYDVTILEDNYTGHESVPGVYTMILQLDFSDDSQEIITLSFEVVSTNLVPDVDTETLSLPLIGFGSGSILLIIGFAIYLKNKKKHRFN